jgi:hypothetical protein
MQCAPDGPDGRNVGMLRECRIEVPLTSLDFARRARHTAIVVTAFNKGALDLRCAVS